MTKEKNKKQKKQTVFSMYKTPHIKLNIEQQKPYCNLGWSHMLLYRRSCSTSGTRRVTFVRNPTMSHEQKSRLGQRQEEHSVISPQINESRIIGFGCICMRKNELDFNKFYFLHRFFLSSITFTGFDWKYE